MKHEIKIDNYSLEELAEKIGDLRYDALHDLLSHLSKKLDKDAENDLKNNRVQLSGYLRTSARELRAVVKSIFKAWEISEPFMKEDSK